MPTDHTYIRCEKNDLVFWGFCQDIIVVVHSFYILKRKMSTMELFRKSVLQKMAQIDCFALLLLMMVTYSLYGCWF